MTYKGLALAEKTFHGNTSASTADHLFFNIKLHLSQLRVVAIPERHSARIKRHCHFGIDINSQVCSVT